MRTLNETRLSGTFYQYGKYKGMGNSQKDYRTKSFFSFQSRNNGVATRLIRWIVERWLHIVRCIWDRFEIIYHRIYSCVRTLTDNIQFTYCQLLLANSIFSHRVQSIFVVAKCFRHNFFIETSGYFPTNIFHTRSWGVSPSSACPPSWTSATYFPPIAKQTITALKKQC